VEGIAYAATDISASGRIARRERQAVDIEDDIRDKERSRLFDAGFIELARAVYVTNDERAAIKKQITPGSARRWWKRELREILISAVRREALISAVAARESAASNPIPRIASTPGSGTVMRTTSSPTCSSCRCSPRQLEPADRPGERIVEAPQTAGGRLRCDHVAARAVPVHVQVVKPVAVSQ